jgi:molybdopterin-binding protein
MKISARNVLPGKVKSVTHGAINSEVIIEINPQVHVVSTITKASAQYLGLVEGREVYAVIKASNVMIATD